MCVMGFDVYSLLCSETFFSRYRFSPLLKNQDFQIQIWSCNAWGFLNEFLWIPWCSMGYKWTTTSFSSSLSKETCGHFFKQSSYNCSITNHSMYQWWQLQQAAKWAWTQSRSAIVKVMTLLLVFNQWKFSGFFWETKNSFFPRMSTATLLFLVSTPYSKTYSILHWCPFLSQFYPCIQRPNKNIRR